MHSHHFTSVNFDNIIKLNLFTSDKFLCVWRRGKVYINISWPAFLIYLKSNNFFFPLYKFNRSAVQRWLLLIGWSCSLDQQHRCTVRLIYLWLFFSRISTRHRKCADFAIKYDDDTKRCMLFSVFFSRIVTLTLISKCFFFCLFSNSSNSGRYRR